MRLYIFNPDSDMALANNDENYMAPASARRMAEDLALLPIWYAQPGSTVLAASAYNTGYLAELKNVFSLSVEILTKPELAIYHNVLQVAPWGWSPALCKELLISGISSSKIPTSEEQKIIRALSSRLFANDVLNLFNNEEYCCGQSAVLSNLLSCKSYVEKNNPCVLKAPWSGSGKGLSWCTGTFTKSISGWCNRILKEQGSIVAEPVYDKVKDFAMEFYSDGQDKVVFMGYSLFTTTPKGAYTGNVLADSKEMENFLTESVPIFNLIRVREKIQQYLTDILSHHYSGYLGVDMMICKSKQSNMDYYIHPCVEINMRFNMGIVAHYLYENFIVPGKTGSFMIEYHRTNDALVEEHRQAREMFPLSVKNGRISSGYLSLVPVTPKSQYRAYVLI